MEYVLVPKEWLERIERKLDEMEKMLKRLEFLAEEEVDEELRKKIAKGIEDVEKGRVKRLDELEW